MLEIARRCTFARDEVVFHEGDPADTVHLIERGRAAARTTTRHGQRATFAVLGPGEAFGELALLGPQARRSASVVAIEPLVTQAIYEADFHRLRHRYPQLTEVVIALLAAHIRRLNSQLLDAQYLPAELRVRKRVAGLAERYEQVAGETLIPLRQEDIADLAAPRARPSTVCCARRRAAAPCASPVAKPQCLTASACWSSSGRCANRRGSEGPPRAVRRLVPQTLTTSDHGEMCPTARVVVSHRHEIP